MRARYDPRILQTYADRLYRQASRITWEYTLLGFPAGFILDFFAFNLMRFLRTTVLPSAAGVLTGPFLGAILGYLYGSSRAFQLRLEAQRTLCQMQIESNTRSAAIAADKPITVPATPPQPEATQEEKDSAHTQTPPPPAQLGAGAGTASESEGTPRKSRTGDVFGLS